MITLADKLLQSAMFSGCSRDKVTRFLSGTFYRLRKKTAGNYIAYMGDECHSVLMLVEGSIYTSMTNKEGKEVIIENIDAPQILAPAFVYTQNNRFPVNVVTKTNCVLLYIDKGAFIDLLRDDHFLMMNFIEELSDRCHKLSRHVYEVSLQTLKERVLEYLKVHKRIENVQWLARVFGVARPSLSRVLSELKAEGVIERTLDGIELKRNT